MAPHGEDLRVGEIVLAGRRSAGPLIFSASVFIAA